MSLPDRLVDIFTDGRPPAAGGGSFRDAADALWRQAGNQRAAAAAAGVDRRTFQRWYQRWNAGKEPRIRPGTATRVEQGLRRLALAHEGDTVSLQVTDHGGRAAGRVRTITEQNLRLAPGTMGRAAETWVRTGDADAAARMFLVGVQVPFYRAWLAAGMEMQRPHSTDPDPGPGGDTGSDDDDEEYDGDEIEDLDAWDEFHDAAADAVDAVKLAPDYGGTVA